MTLFIHGTHVSSRPRPLLDPFSVPLPLAGVPSTHLIFCKSRTLTLAHSCHPPRTDTQSPFRNPFFLSAACESASSEMAARRPTAPARMTSLSLTGSMYERVSFNQPLRVDERARATQCQLEKG